MQKSKLPICLYYGDEDFLIDGKIKELKAKFSAHEFIDGEKISLTALSDALCGGSLFAADKLVIIKDPKFAVEDQAAVVDLLGNVSDGTTVVFVSSNVDKRTKLYKLINERGEAIEFKTFAPWEQAALLGWIRKRALQGGKTISEDGAQLLQEICGNNLRLLAGEIEKLITYAGERKEISEDDVSRLASPGEISAFALLDALRFKKTGEALNLFQQLIKNREDLFQLTGLLAHQYRTMLQIKSANSRDPNYLAGMTGGRPFFIKKCLENIDGFSLIELKEILGLLLDANLKLKTGEQKEAAFELLLVSLCRRQNA